MSNREYAPLAVKAGGGGRFNNSAAWRMDKDVPLVSQWVPPCRPLPTHHRQSNCFMIQMVVALSSRCITGSDDVSSSTTFQRFRTGKEPTTSSWMSVGIFELPRGEPKSIRTKSPSIARPIMKSALRQRKEEMKMVNETRRRRRRIDSSDGDDGPCAVYEGIPNWSISDGAEEDANEARAMIDGAGHRATTIRPTRRSTRCPGWTPEEDEVDVDVSNRNRRFPMDRTFGSWRDKSAEGRRDKCRTDRTACEVIRAGRGEVEALRRSRRGADRPRRRARCLSP